MVAFAAASSSPALSDSSESNLNATVGLAVAGRRPSYPSRIRVKSLSGLRTLPRHNLPLRSSFKFVIASASLQVQVRDCGLSSRVPSFSRLWDVSFKLVIAARSESLHSRVFGRMALRRVGSWRRRARRRRRGLSGRTRSGLAWLACRVGQCYTIVSLTSRRCPWRLTGRQSRQPIVCSAAAMAQRDRPSVTVAPVVITYPDSSHTARRMSAAPAVSTHGDSQAFSRAKGVSPTPQWAGTCSLCISHSDFRSGRAGLSSLRVDRLATRSESTVPN